MGCWLQIDDIWFKRKSKWTPEEFCHSNPEITDGSRREFVSLKPMREQQGIDLYSVNSSFSGICPL